MGLNLKTNINLIINDGDEELINVNIDSKMLRKKERKQIATLVVQAQAQVKDDSLASMDTIEEAAKIRFGLQVTGTKKDIDSLTDFAEDFGYTTLLAEIDGVVQDTKGK